MNDFQTYAILRFYTILFLPYVFRNNAFLESLNLASLCSAMLTIFVVQIFPSLQSDFAI